MLDNPPPLKPFQTRGLVRRVTPFMGAGLVALVVFSDPTFTRLPWADALAVVVAGGVIAAALAPIDWDRLPRLTIAAPTVLALLLALGATFTQGSPISLAAAATGVLVIVGIYVMPWDGLPRWVHELPVFGGLVAVFVIQATVHPPGYAVAAVLLVFPLYLTTVLFAALYHTRNEVMAATALASIGILVLSVSGGPQPGEPAISILVVAVLWVVVLTVHAVVAERKRSEDAVRALNEQLVQLLAERTNSNAQLAEQKGLVESLLQSLSNMDVGLVVVVGSTIQSVNNAFSRLTGYGGPEGKPLPEVADIIAPEYVDQFRRIRAARAAGLGGVLVQEWEVTTSNGRRVPVQSISHSEMINGDQRAVVLVLDITERKRTERALAESQSRLQAIIDTSLNAIVTMDEQGLISDWNPQAEATFGWSRNEILGKVLADTIIPPQYRDAHRVGLARYLLTGEGPVLGKVLELSAIDKNGREFPVELAITRASVLGEKAVFVGFVRDITTRKEAERAINDLNAELQVANQHKSEFLANMSHELRTPLNAILGFSELLLDDTSRNYDAATREKFLSQINTSGRHLLGLINDILDLSKVEAGQMELELETVSVSDTVAQVIDTIEPIATKKGVKLEAHAEAGGPVEADASKLTQMLLNLVSNAVKFTPKGGSVTISARRLANKVEISVSDTGIGIAESDFDRLFREFQQLDTGAGRHEEGTGLGLALTKRLAVLHGGDVRVASEVGKGSVFTIELPIKQQPAGKPAPAPRPAADAALPVVLVVEDNHQAADLLVRQLERGGFQGVVAANGDEALAKALELRPVAITLDILLPGIDGWDVLARLKRDDATRDIPVVVVSVVDKPELGRALGAMDYFVKPVDGKELLARLAKFTFTNKVGTEETRVLVIDDEPANVQWLEGVLKPAGFSVTSAAGGKDGIELARSIRPHLILLDLMMPEVSGFDVVAALEADQATRSIPIMILTAKDLTDEDKRQLKGHAKAILARGSTGATDLLGWLDRVMAVRP